MSATPIATVEQRPGTVAAPPCWKLGDYPDLGRGPELPSRAELAASGYTDETDEDDDRDA